MTDVKAGDAPAEKVAPPPVAAGAGAASSAAGAAAAEPEPEPTPEPLKERVLGPQTYIFDSPLRMLLMAALPLVLFAVAPWAMWVLTPPKLPEVFVRPSTEAGLARVGAAGQQLSCRNLNVAQPDPWRRSGGGGAQRDRAMQALAYCEDAKLLPAHGVAVLACDPGRHRWNTVMGTLVDPEPRGALWVWDYARDSPAPSLVAVQGFPDEFDFHPLGMELHEDPAAPAATGTIQLFVVSSRRRNAVIEVFDLAPGTGDQGWVATYVRTLQHPQATHAPNAVALLDSTTLLVSNDHLFPARAPPVEHLTYLYTQLLGPVVGPALARTAAVPRVSLALSKLETLLGLPLAWVAAIDLGVPAPDTSGKVVARGLAFANGVAVSPRGSTVAVAETMAGAVRMYRPVWGRAIHGSGSSSPRRLESLRQFDSVPAPMLVDNLDFTPPLWNYTLVLNGTRPDPFDGAKLLAAGHPTGLRLLQFAADPTRDDKQSGSWALSLEPAGAPPRGARMSLASWRSFQDGTRVPASKQARAQHKHYAWKSLYQAKRGFVKQQGFGVPTSSSVLWDPTPNGKGALLVAGLYSRGVLACRHAAVE